MSTSSYYVSEMNMKIYEDLDSNNSVEVPWINEYLSTRTDIPLEFHCRVFKIVLSEKGFLVIGEHYKNFAYANSTVWTHLIEAFDYWSTNPKDCRVPGIFLYASRKIKMGFDEEVMDCYMSMTNGKTVEIKWGKLKNSSEFGNPFLSQSTSL